MPDVEFLGSDGGDGEELLDSGPRRTASRRTVLVALGVVAVLGLLGLAGVVFSRGSRTPASLDLPSVTRSLAPHTVTPAPQPVTPAHPGLPLRDVRAVVASDGIAWSVDSGRMQVSGSFGEETLTDPVPIVLLPGASTSLLVDTSIHQLWLVVTGRGPGQIAEYNSHQFIPDGRIGWPQALSAAAVYDHRLYVTSGRQLLVARGERLHAVATFNAPLGRLAADPARHRLLVLGAEAPTPVWTFRPGHLARHRALGIGGTTVQVVDGAIWAGGRRQGQTVLTRLDPATLRPSAPAPAARFARRLREARLVASGGTALWVRDGADLWCADATTGAPLQRKRTPAVVAADAKRTYFSRGKYVTERASCGR